MRFSNFADDVKHPDHTVSTAHCEHISRVAEVQGVTGAREAGNLGARLKHLVSIENFDFV